MSFKVSVVLNSGEELVNRGTIPDHIAMKIQEAVTAGGRISIEIEENTMAIIPTASINYVKVTKVVK